MIREATMDELTQLQQIYNDAVMNTTATFDTEVKDRADRIQWFEAHQQSPYVILVHEEKGEVCGYASLSQYRTRKAFDSTAEVSIYIHKDHRGKGIGNQLMEAILENARSNERLHTVMSVITGDNITSRHLHEKYGFVYCGITRQVGYKHDQWLDLTYYQIMV